MPDEFREHDQKHAEAMATELHRHFDTVQIFVSRCEPDGKTIGYTTGRGNWYARRGQVGYWFDTCDFDAIEGGDECDDQP